jgi:DNA-binding FrmR family transcriptional regulator
MCTEINNFSTFETLSDFSVNNLYIDIKGEIKKRVDCDYTIDDIIEQIKNKKLINIVNKTFVETHLDEHIDFPGAYENRFKENREKKMIEYGFSY